MDNCVWNPDMDAYNKGEHYICLIDGNTWSPAEYPAGWAKQ